MFEWIDGKVLAKYQKFTDTCQDWFGVTKFFWEKWSYVIFCLMFCSLLLRSILTSESTLFISFCVFAIFIFFVSLIGGVMIIESDERNFLAGGTPRFRPNHSFERRFFLSFFWGIFLSLDLVFWDWSGVLIDVAAISNLYFGACIPKPPSRSKFKDWLAKVIWKLSGNDQAEPNPA